MSLDAELPSFAYRRIGDRTFDDTSGGGALQALLEYDSAGLILDYPGIAVRFA